MDIERLIDGFEKLCYRIMIELVLLPKTLWLLIKRAKNCYDLVAEAYGKTTDEPAYQSLSSPIKLVIFYIAFSLWFLTELKNEPEVKESILATLLAMDLTHQVVVLFIISSFIPLITSLIVVKSNKASIPSPVFKLSLDAVFYTRVYYYLSIICLYLLSLSEYRREFLKKNLEITEDMLDSMQVWFGYFYLAVLCWAVYMSLRSYYHVLRSMIARRSTVIWTFLIFGVGEAVLSLLQILGLMFAE